MKVILFGGTGMVGQGVLRECLLAPDVDTVVSVGRRPLGQRHVKLHEIIIPDLSKLDGNDPVLAGIDACFYCLGVSSLGMSEAEYTAVTHDLTMSVASALAVQNRGLTFVFVSGAGTDSTERGRSMWARVKGRTENDVLRAGFRAAYMFRPGFIIPLHGIRSVTTWYNVVYAVLRPFVPLIRRVGGASVTTTEQMGRAMLAVARSGYRTPILAARDINSL
jgi:uncharacterized protein YbjT (DUF2867 family)